MITLLVLLVLAIAVVLGVPAIRKKVVTRPVFGIFKKPWVDRELLKRVDSLKHLRLAAARRNRRATDLRTS